MPRPLVADAGPLIALARLDLLHIFAGLGKTIYVPKAVVEECSHDLAKPGARTIQAAIKSRILLTRKAPASPLPSIPPTLGAGEVEAIRLALKLDAVVLLDDLLARRAAKRAGLSIVGVSGLLLAAKRARVLPRVAPLLLQLQATGYRLSDRLVNEVLVRAGEG